MSKLSRKIQTLTHGQLWVATVAILFLACLTYKARSSWENAYFEQAELTQRTIANGLKIGGEIGLNAIQLSNTLHDSAVEFGKTRSWVSPLVSLIVFVVAPVLILCLHWIWHRAR